MPVSPAGAGKKRCLMNPYQILNIDKNATSREIIQAAALAMRERKYTGWEVAVAQKTLMEPLSRATEAFICFIDVPVFQKELRQTCPETESDPEPVANLKYIPIK